ncbi:hypothetical protein GCM10010483_67160 [Actinokineospora diospyrosa]
MDTEILRVLVTQGTTGASVAAVLFLILKHGPHALQTVLGEVRKHRLFRQALYGKSEKLRQRARDLLRLELPGSDEPPPEVEERPPPLLDSGDEPPPAASAP